MNQLLIFIRNIVLIFFNYRYIVCYRYNIIDHLINSVCNLIQPLICLYYYFYIYIPVYFYIYIPLYFKYIYPIVWIIYSNHYNYSLNYYNLECLICYNIHKYIMFIKCNKPNDHYICKECYEHPYYNITKCAFCQIII